MLLDVLTLASDNASLTGIAAAATGFSNVIDITTSRDLGPDSIPYFVLFGTAPTSATNGATLNAALQTSDDNATWHTIDETSATLISGFNTQNTFLFRGHVPVGTGRYLRFAYTPSAVLTAGTVTASIGADWPRVRDYPRNYVA